MAVLLVIRTPDSPPQQRRRDRLRTIRHADARWPPLVEACENLRQRVDRLQDWKECGEFAHVGRALLRKKRSRTRLRGRPVWGWPSRVGAIDFTSVDRAACKARIGG